MVVLKHHNMQEDMPSRWFQLSAVDHRGSRHLYKSARKTAVGFPRTGTLCTSHCILQYSYYYYYWYSALGPVWAETRVQSGDWYGSGTLHPGQVLRGSLPLFSPRFLDVPLFTTRCLHVRHNVRDPSGGSGNCGLYFPSEGRRAEDFFRP